MLNRKFGITSVFCAKEVIVFEKKKQTIFTRNFDRYPGCTVWANRNATSTVGDDYRIKDINCPKLNEPNNEEFQKMEFAILEVSYINEGQQNNTKAYSYKNYTSKTFYNAFS